MLSMRQVLTLILLLTAFLYASVVIVEMPDDNARPVFVANVVDGDTVEVSD
jgi:endonuclease YncB( thermonuclease family)